MVASVLTVNAVNYNQAARKSNSLLVDGYGWDVDSDYWLEFHECNAGPQPKIVGPKACSLSVGGTTVFQGNIVTNWPTIGANGRTWAYRALGLKYRANGIPVTDSDGSGVMRFNVNPAMDLDNYVPSLAGLSVGVILSNILTQHATALTAAGITTDATTTSQLAALTLVPADQVIVSGEHLWLAMESVTRRHARNIRLIILPSGLVRVVDVTAGAAHTLTLGTDPVDPPLMSRNWTNCATRTIVRGRGLIEPAYVSVLKSTLTAAWSGAQQAAWTYADFTNAGGAKSDGTVTTVNSATQVTVQSASGTETWATNKWSGLQAWIYLTKGSGSGLTYTESRPITANSALTAGGTATITVAYDLVNSASTAYDSYAIIGTNIPLSSTGRADVWRLYNITDPGGLIANHLVTQFPVQVPFIDYYGQSAQLVTSPSGQIVGPNAAGPAFFQVLPTTGQILFYHPVVEQTSSVAQMNAGGANVVTPTDIYLLLAYSRGALQAVYPPDIAGVPQYSGTAYSIAGLAKTQYVDVPSWGYAGNVSVLNQLAQMIQQSTRDTLIEGSVRYKGYYATVQDPSGGHLLSFAGHGYTTGDESLAIPVRGVSYRYLTTGGGLNYITEMRCSTRRDPRTGESQYMHLSALGSGAMFGAQLGEAFAAGGMVMGGQAGFGYEVAGTQAADLTGVGEAFAGAEQLAESGGMTNAQAREAMEGGVSARGPSAKEAREAMEGPRQRRRPRPRRRPQGLKGLKGTAYERDMAAAEHGQYDKAVEGLTEDFAREESIERGTAYYGRASKNELERDQKRSARRLQARKDRERSAKFREQGISNMGQGEGGGGMGTPEDEGE
jgi:hypothetical protein